MTDKREGWATYACKNDVGTLSDRPQDASWEAFCMARNDGGVCDEACEGCLVAADGSGAGASEHIWARATEAPERIWARPGEIMGWNAGFFYSDIVMAELTAYIRLDLHEAAVAAARTITDADIERVAAAWASIDGKTDRYNACKADPAVEDVEGHYHGYFAEARELLCRSGLFTYTATFVLRTEGQP